MADKEDEFSDEFSDDEKGELTITAAARSRKGIKGVPITIAAGFGKAPTVVTTAPKAPTVPKPSTVAASVQKAPTVAASVQKAPTVAASVPKPSTVAASAQKAPTAPKPPTATTVSFYEAPATSESTSNAAGFLTENASNALPKLPADPIKIKPLKPSITLPATTAAEVDAFTQMTMDEFVSPEMDAMKTETVKRNPVEVKPDEVAKLTIPDPANPGKTKTETLSAYRPITAPSFNDFIVQTYMRYSPALTQLEQDLEKGITAPVIKERELDPDACLKRDPNKVETFYYQKFVRDYLGRDTPYRGLLVYHGLGSGKTCTSVAAAEALYWGGLKKIYILTPATLSANYRRELGKCGYYPLRRHNYWSFLKSSGSPSARAWLVDSLGLPSVYVDKLGGGWVANPKKASNWDDLEEAERKSILEQQETHITHRFFFIHYNGVSPEVLANYAARGVQGGKSMFDDGVVIIDEVHNLVRTINGTKIGSRTLAQYIKDVEPREFTWSVPKYREVTGFRYPRGYSLYRMLQNAVGAKIVALSATPMINYAQELGILMNIVGGEQRVVELSLKYLRKGKDLTREIEEWAKKHPAIDFFKIEQSSTGRDSVLTVTPVPHGFVKVVGKDFSTRGFVRPPVPADARDSRERNMDTWAVQLVKDLEAAGFVDAGLGASTEAATAVATARALGPGNLPKTAAFSLLTYPMLPEAADKFVDNFIDRARLRIINDNILRARSLGLVSYYRGGAEDLMPRSKRIDIRVPMSDYMFKEYIAIRNAEIEEEKKKKGEDNDQEPAMVRSGRRVTETEMDLYAQATKTQKAGFHARTRAACNWVFPEDVKRPLTSLTDREREELLELKNENEILATEIGEGAPGESSSNVPAGIDGPEEGGGAPAAVTDEPLSKKLQSIIGTLMKGLEANAEDYLHTGLINYSAKYALMIENIRTSPGPVLVYSQFKTLEGLGIFAAALRASDEQYLPLDIVRGAGGEWSIPEFLMDESLRDRPRYIMYTGDQELEKRRLLLQLYNADVSGLPHPLSEQCATLLGLDKENPEAGEKDNRNGRICRVFMITQSGAEGISLFNTRQVHIMEPYWNNVRIEQVIGRAIRLCSHMRLPWDDRLVNVFTYMSVFSEEQKQSKDGDAKTVLMFDSYKSTEETINDIATVKQQLADGLSEIAQSAAVDCNLHFHEHGEVTKCFNFGTGRRPLFSYHPDWEKDIADAGLRSVA